MVQRPDSSQQTNGQSQRGQIVVEYVLLLVVGVAVATLITSQLVSRNPNNTGFLVKKWIDILQVIGKDTADDLNP